MKVEVFAFSVMNPVFKRFGEIGPVLCVCVSAKVYDASHVYMQLQFTQICAIF
jgi:hypothetical protein